jgi:hypothetical protein
MSKHIEKLKKQLVEVSEVVNAFRSEAVQVRIIDRLLEVMIDSEKMDAEGTEILSKKKRMTYSDAEGNNIPGRKKPGATKILNQLLHTDFFNISRSIAKIADYCREQFDADFKTSELSGILLKLANEHKLRRERNDENNRFEYIKFEY